MPVTDASQPTVYAPTPADIDALTRMTVGEAQGEPDAGQAAVVHVALNRLAAGTYGKSLAAVIAAPGQFESADTPASAYYTTSPQTPAYKKAASIVQGVLAGQIPDPTNGATNFFAPVAQQAMGRAAPQWANGQPTAVIGGHQFYAPQGPSNGSALLAPKPPQITGPDGSLGETGLPTLAYADGPSPATPQGSPQPMASSAPAQSDLDYLNSLAPKAAPAAQALGVAFTPPLGAATPAAAAGAATLASPTAAASLGSDEAYVDALAAKIAAATSSEEPVVASTAPSATAAPPVIPGPLSNAPDDGYIAGMLKGGATAAVKGAADVPGVFGNLGNLATYLGDRGTEAVNKLMGGSASLEQVQAQNADARAKFSAAQQSTPLGRAAAAMDPMRYMPSGQTISNALFNHMGSGEYVPQTTEGKAAMGGVEAAVGGAGLSGANALMGGVKALAAPAGTNALMGAAGTEISERTHDPLLGLAATAAIPAALPLVGRGLGAMAGSTSPETAALADLARNKFGIDVNATQMSENPGVRLAGSALDNLPFSGAAGDMAAQRTAFNRAASNTIGEDAPKLTPDVMLAAKTRIGAAFDNVANNTTVKADPQFQNDLQSTLLGAHQEISADEFKPLNVIFDNIMSKVDGNGDIAGPTYQAITRTGTPLDRAVESTNPNVSHWAGQIKTALQGALQRSAAPEYQDQLAQAKAQWANLMALKPLAAKSTTGDISPALLQGSINRGTGDSLAFGGGGDLGDLARIGQRFLKPPPNSGTADRLTAAGTIKQIGGALSGLGGTMFFGNQLGVSPNEMALSAAAIPAGALAARGVGAALRSDWLAKNTINNSLMRGYQPSGASSLLFGAVPPYALQSAPNPALPQ